MAKRMARWCVSSPADRLLDGAIERRTYGARAADGPTASGSSELCRGELPVFVVRRPVVSAHQAEPSRGHDIIHAAARGVLAPALPVQWSSGYRRRLSG